MSALTLSRRIERPKSSHSGEAKRTVGSIACQAFSRHSLSVRRKSRDRGLGEASSNRTVTTPTKANIASRFMR